jgi:flagellar hook protein FlgE
MGLFDALTTAVSGLQAQSFAMQNISGNIANSQTTAYKGIETNFEDLIPGDSVPTRQIAGGGVIANSRATNNARVQSKARRRRRIWPSTAMAFSSCRLQPDSMEISRSLAALTAIHGAATSSWTRTAIWSTAPAIFLRAFQSTRRPAIQSAASPPPCNSRATFCQPSATTQVNYGINLPSTPQTNAFVATTPNSELLNPTDFSAGHDPTVAGTGIVVGSDVSMFVNESIDGGSVTIYDPIGTPANLQLRWAKTDSVANGGADIWELFYQTDATATGTDPAWINAGTDFVFDANGQLNPPITNVALAGVSINGTALGNITINSPTGGITQFANTSGVSTVNNLQQNGYAAGQLKSIAVSDAGNIIGTFSNGQNVALAQVPLVHFNSPNNLKALDGGAYQLTNESGPALTGSSGKIIGQSLEASNTDIATEFTKLIVTQQAYSANTKVITTANQMSQDLLNVIR